jgi:hypothetical protein
MMKWVIPVNEMFDGWDPSLFVPAVVILSLPIRFPSLTPFSLPPTFVQCVCALCCFARKRGRRSDHSHSHPKQMIEVFLFYSAKRGSLEAKVEADKKDLCISSESSDTKSFTH